MENTKNPRTGAITDPLPRVPGHCFYCPFPPLCCQSVAWLVPSSEIPSRSVLCHPISLLLVHPQTPHHPGSWILIVITITARPAWQSQSPSQDPRQWGRSEGD